MKKIKIVDYKGNVIDKWMYPKTEKDYIKSIVNLARFYYRCKKSKLLTNEIISFMKEFLETVQKKVTVAMITHPEIITAIKEIKELTPHGYQEEWVIEKIRKHKLANCSLCTTHLKYPAFVVYRSGNKIVQMSEPVGIFCLKKTMGKLQNLITNIKIETENPKKEYSKKNKINKNYSLF